MGSYERETHDLLHKCIGKLGDEKYNETTNASEE